MIVVEFKLGRNICARWSISEVGLWQKWKLGRLFVFNTGEINEITE